MASERLVDHFLLWVRRRRRRAFSIERGLGRRSVLVGLAVVCLMGLF